MLNLDRRHPPFKPLKTYSLDSFPGRGYTMDMKAKFTLEYWQDQAWYVGRLREVPGVFSQGETLKDLERNIRDVYALMMKEQDAPRKNAHSKPILVAA